MRAVEKAVRCERNVWLSLGAFVGALQCSLLLGTSASTEALPLLLDDGTAAQGIIENRGQWPEDVLYALARPRQTIWFTRDGLVIDRFELEQLRADHRRFATTNAFERAENLSARGVVLRARFVDASSAPIVEANAALPAVYHYFIGAETSRWRSHVRSFSEVRYRGVYPGVDVLYRVDGNGSLKYDVLVAPGADARAFRVRYEGIDALSLSPGGDLRIETAMGQFLEERPTIYQEINGRRIEVEGVYELRDRTTLSYSVGRHDPAYSLVIDPRLLWSTFLGSSGNEAGQSVAHSADGGVIIGGYTLSPSFPTTIGAYDRTYNGSIDIFVSKLSSSGRRLIFSTFIGSPGIEGGAAPIETLGGIYVVAGTNSPFFPTTPGAFDRTYNGGDGDGVVVKLSLDGSAILFSTFFGGSGNEMTNLLIDRLGNIVLNGATSSPNFPTTSDAYDNTYNGAWDGYVAKLSPDASALVHSTFFGGTGEDIVAFGALGPNEILIVGGSTQSPDFPVSPGAFDESFNGAQDGFLVAFDLSQDAFGFRTYVGGSDLESVYGVAVDSLGQPVLAGETDSWDYPTSAGAFDVEIGPPTDGFVTKLNATGTTLVMSTFLGGLGFDFVQAAATTQDGSVVATGSALSMDFPVTPGVFGGAPFNGGESDAYLSVIASDGEALRYSTCIGGGDGEAGIAVAVGADDRWATMTGYTLSGNFPVTPRAYDAIFGGQPDAYVTSVPLVSDAPEGSAKGAATAADPPEVALSVASPSYGEIAASVTIPRAGAASLAISDVAGRRVLERAFVSLPRGVSRIQLAPKGGEALAAGVYFVRVVTPDGAASRKVLILR